VPESAHPSPFTPEDRVWRFLDRAVSGLARRSLRSGAKRVPQSPALRTTQARIERITVLAEGVRSFELASLSGEALPAWQPGCHVDVTLPSGRQRQYSLCGDLVDTRRYRIAVRHLPQGAGGSVELHSLREHDVLRIGTPRNAFPFIDAPRYFFVAGGIGITAILPMLRLAQARGAEWTFAYLGRSRASLPFLDEIAALSAHDPGRVHIWADDEQHGMAPVARLIELAPASAPLYACGPAPLLAALRALAPHPRITSLHDERFAPAAVLNGAAFEIELARSGGSVQVGARESALAAIRRRLPHVAYSCQQGFCGTCKVQLLAGDVEHRDSALTPEQRRAAMTLCVSRGRGRIVVDL